RESCGVGCVGAKSFKDRQFQAEFRTLVTDMRTLASVPPLRGAPVEPPAVLDLGRGNVALLPRPSPGYLDLEREAQECADEDDHRQYRHAGQGGRGGDGTDDIAGHEQLQAEQNRLAQLLAETPVNISLVPG